MPESQSPEREERTFKTEITQLLDILIHSLYKERDIFLRELVSNASDALTRVRFEMLTNQDVRDPDAELAIRISIDEETDRRILVISDTGIGMNREELGRNLGTIAQSGAKEFLQHIADDDSDAADIIGQFGVGFYSVFMVAEEVRVVSQSFRHEDTAVAWTSRGGERYWIEDAERDQRGTTLYLVLKNDAVEFGNEFLLRQTIKKYSDYVSYPIYLDNETVNQQAPLWRKAPTEVNEDERRQFYQQLTMDFEEPLSTIHLSSDAPLHVRSLLFVPRFAERSPLHLRPEPGLKLYAHNVLIQEYCTDLLPKWLDFIDGVVESEDLPLNVSRETIQNAPTMRQLARTLRRRVLKELENVAAKDVEKYRQLWESFGRHFKEGLVTDSHAKDEILPLLRFYTTAGDGDLTSLDQYISRMPSGQEEIYYLLGDSLQTVTLSPHLDPFTERDYEVLLLVDVIDPFITPLLAEYKEKKLRNIDEASIELPPVEPTSTEDSLSPVGNEIAEADFNRLVGRFVTTLGDRILEVRQSRVLRGNPVRLVVPADSAAGDLDRMQRYLDREYKVPKRILEVNRGHALIGDLAIMIRETPQDELINLTIEQLYENALILEGLHPNPTAMLPGIQRLLELATARVARPSSDEEE